MLTRIFEKKKDRPIKEKADRIFNSLRDHTHKNKNLWSVFGFGFTVPSELILDNHALFSGHLRFDFSREKDSFIFQQFSVANIILKEKTLSQWANEFCSSHFKSVNIKTCYLQEKKPPLPI